MLLLLRPRNGSSSGGSLEPWHMYVDVSFLPPPSSVPHLDIRVYRQSNCTGMRSLYYSARSLDWLSHRDIFSQFSLLPYGLLRGLLMLSLLLCSYSFLLSLFNTMLFSLLCNGPLSLIFYFLVLLLYLKILYFLIFFRAKKYYTIINFFAELLK